MFTSHFDLYNKVYIIFSVCCLMSMQERIENDCSGVGVRRCGVCECGENQLSHGTEFVGWEANYLLVYAGVEESVKSQEILLPIRMIVCRFPNN